MKLRVKFRKNGPMKFIGHLDIMRYFQKAIRRSGIEIAYSEGYSPHMIMLFAAPLGVGSTSDGDYFDMEVKSADSSAEMVRRLNETMAGGMEVVSVRRIPQEKSSNAMSMVAAADYLVSFREGCELPVGWQSGIEGFLAQPEILCMKKTKKGEKEVDIRPWIYRMEPRGEGLFLQVSSGSVRNLKPEQVLSSFASYLQITLSEFALMVHRLEVYADLGDEHARRLIPLEDLGEEIE